MLIIFNNYVHYWDNEKFKIFNSKCSAAQLVSGMKNLNQQGIRQSVPATVSLTQGQQIQLITSLQGQRLQQANLQQNITRTIQRTPITIKMASTPPNTSQLTDLKFDITEK